MKNPPPTLRISLPHSACASSAASCSREANTCTCKPAISSPLSGPHRTCRGGWFGLRAIFGDQRFRAFAPIAHNSPAAEWVLVQLLEPSRASQSWDPRKALQVIGERLAITPPPWLSRSTAASQHVVFPYLRHRPVAPRSRPLNAEQIFAVFCILAVAVEVSGERGGDFVKELEALDIAPLTGIVELLKNRLSPVPNLPGFAIDFGFGFDEKQAGIVRQWMNRDLNFVGQ